MKIPISYYYLLGVFSLCFTFILMYVFRRRLGRFILDNPGGLKRHNGSIPLVGGCGIISGLTISIIVFLLLNHISFIEINTFLSLLLGGCVVFVMGLLDDLKKPKGLSVSSKLFIQISSAIILYNGLSINCFQSTHWNFIFTILWIVGLINAFNLLDILDGLCSTQAIIAFISIFIIAHYSEIMIINCITIAMVGACLGFIPYNFSVSHKCFLGDSGSNLIGYLISALCLSLKNDDLSFKTILISLLIVAVPLIDIAFVIISRLLHGKNPLKGSRDHLSLKLKDAGWPLYRILGVFIICSFICNSIALLIFFY